MKKLFLLFILVFLFSCNKVKNTTWYCESPTQKTKIEFLTSDKGMITNTGSLNNIIPFSYTVEGSNITITVTPNGSNSFLYDIATLDKEHNCLRLRQYFNGNCFTKIK